MYIDMTKKQISGSIYELPDIPRKLNKAMNFFIIFITFITLLTCIMISRDPIIQRNHKRAKARIVRAIKEGGDL